MARGYSAKVFYASSSLAALSNFMKISYTKDIETLKNAILKKNLEISKETRHSGTVDVISSDLDTPSCGVIVENSRGIIGWGVHFSKLNEFHIFVSPRHRRKGVGTKILKVAKKNIKEIKICPWDKRSRKFFGNFDFEPASGYCLMSGWDF